MQSLTDRIRFSSRTNITPDTYEGFMRLVEGVIGVVTCGMTSQEFADTVFTHDAFEDGEDPRETAERILEGDTIGSAMLDLYLNGKG